MRPVPFTAVAAAAWAGVAGLALRGPFEPETSLCPFRLLTGHACPGCGMGRALVAAMRGDFALSFAHHPLGLPLLALWTAWLAWGAVNALRGRGFSEGLPAFVRRPGAALAALVLVLVVHAARSWS